MAASTCLSRPSSCCRSVFRPFKAAVIDMIPPRWGIVIHQILPLHTQNYLSAGAKFPLYQQLRWLAHLLQRVVVQPEHEMCQTRRSGIATAALPHLNRVAVPSSGRSHPHGPWANVDRKDVTRWQRKIECPSCTLRTGNRKEAGSKLRKRHRRNTTLKGSWS